MKKMIDIEPVSEEVIKEIDAALDQAEALVDKYHIYFHEAISVVYGTKTLAEVLKEHEVKHEEEVN